MIATKDIARVTADTLMKLDFTGHSVRPLLGARNCTMSEVAGVLGKAIGKPALAYVQYSSDQAKQGMQQMGMSASMALLRLSFVL